MLASSVLDFVKLGYRRCKSFFMQYIYLSCKDTIYLFVYIGLELDFVRFELKLFQYD